MDMKNGNGTWGHCNHCRYFGSPAKAPLGGEEASCKEPRLAKFRLRVFGACGCDAFKLRAGMAETVEQPRT